METISERRQRQAKDLVEVLKSERQRGGVAHRSTPRYLSDEKPEGDFFELPRRWIEPTGK